MLWLTCGILVVISGFYVLRPLFSDNEDALNLELLKETETDRLLERKAVVYGNLRDLEFEYSMGRLSESDFRQLKAGYTNEVSTLLETIAGLNRSDNFDATVEKDIAAHKSALYGDKQPPAGKDSRCPKCGAPIIITGKNFCADCGGRLSIQ
ncbi:MAG TPA: zinc ribbon domain-containing protein [Acidobacteriota bacterium]|nr:zinc ribbon domain-containing protein [Acidobacteriota bacterium]